MKATLFPCGQAANESEIKAYEHLRRQLQSSQGNDEWVLLTNLTLAINHQLQSDEIDIVVIGPPGVHLIEIKHWTAQWVDAHADLVGKEADRVMNKARKIGTTLRKNVPKLPRVDGAILLTQEVSKVKRLSEKSVRGVKFFTLNDWKALLSVESRAVLDAYQVAMLSRVLEPKSSVATDGTLRRLAGYVNLALQTPKEERFHRVYKGSQSVRQDRVVLHLYDLSASDEKNAEVQARREFEALHRLQFYSWAPRILDSFQDAPGYSGEMFFFTIVDPVAPSVAERLSDPLWGSAARLAFSRRAISALRELHAAGLQNSPMIHRNINPKTILVKHDNSPILIGFERTRIPLSVSIGAAATLAGQMDQTTAPEVQSGGFPAADQRSDVFSLCASLCSLFSGYDDEISKQALETLEEGMSKQPEDRLKLEDLDSAFSNLISESATQPPPPPARFWTEDQEIDFRDRRYRIIARLGSGGVGATFKVVEIDRVTKEDLGTYVAKVAHHEEDGQRVLKAYSLARSHLARHADLSAIFEVAREWHANEFLALMTWVEGAPLGEFIGVFPLLAEEQQEKSVESLALRWLRDMCQALGVLHRNGLVHGDVSPRNIIVSAGNLVLTDYDCVNKIGEPFRTPGTVLYCSPSYQNNIGMSPSDDIYSLAATFFHVVFEKEPFQHGGMLAKERGLNWQGVVADEYPILTSFLDKATSPDPMRRFATTEEALDALRTSASIDTPMENIDGRDERKASLPVPVHQETIAAEREELHENNINWVFSLLQSYPGSRWGNQETRGLDTEFAAQTYVETNLEETLLSDIRERKVRLVILCGNAGDGKTALLQHLAECLGLGQHASAERVLEGQIEDRLVIRMNLDGSAAWRDRSADDILDEFLSPFRNGPPSEDIVHLLAINDGRLLEWIEGVQARQEWAGSPLTEELGTLLQEDEKSRNSYILFISLNQRSLVGGIASDRGQITTDFLDRLLDHLYGAEKASQIWSSCQSCSAKDRCEIVRALRVFGPPGLPNMAEDVIRLRARERLFAALQAVHLRGETHITIRELRAALVYILFGIHACQDYHEVSDVPTLSYWDRAFSPDSPGRQGDVLRELARFDPALEAHPQIDRFLVSSPSLHSTKSAPRYNHLPLESARRRAYFEWTENNLEDVAGDSHALDLSRGKHLRLFRNLPLENSEMDLQQRASICRQLCGGISRLEDLPPQALDRQGVVPLRITPRTPTETAFWIEKKLSAFSLEADLPLQIEGIDRLHRQARLVYHYRNGGEERLRLGAELFHLLLELSDGYQLGDVSTDDTFAHLSVFVQRLVREDEREMLAWNPMQHGAIYRISAEPQRDSTGPVQQLVLMPALQGGDA